jgi:hypothetical protein
MSTVLTRSIISSACALLGASFEMTMVCSGPTSALLRPVCVCVCVCVYVCVAKWVG